MALNILYTAHATATGGRNGHTQTADGQVSHDLSIPKSMGGPGKPGTTTPEDLFAAGYAACFGSACDFVAKSVLKLNPGSIEILCDVGIGTRPEGGFGLKVGLTARIGGLSKADVQALVAKAHEVCPYSNATRNNVEVTLKTEVA
ncbi:organic hydroperoxide resistance protein [Ralstonia pseudosolanacearum]|uniref:Organic hydroperoxide resistance protein n=1 Tax=Ralstonia solanacearum TaxID=305 RepID=A0A0S4TNH8_RALSL|nr:organic hydroperoxide resistance protein [Ralstonia pseudosolanacearum]OAI77762.1 organic hydroperoxide resistance protein [Ralstonia solanacearum]QCX51279.1 organic hydroperoxide resistance protein [Ralstonia pseudosolanacearum]CUV11620.1 Organic hydroperoxide resistance protein [Ralstonia solanacearum]